MATVVEQQALVVEEDHRALVVVVERCCLAGALMIGRYDDIPVKAAEYIFRSH